MYNIKGQVNFNPTHCLHIMLKRYNYGELPS